MKQFIRVISLALALILFFGSMPVTAFAAGDTIYGIAFITGSNVRLRSKASTGSSSKILDTTNKNEVAVVLSKHGDWYKVIYDLQEGYMHGDYLKVSKTQNAELGYGKINGTSVNLRSGAGTSYSKVNKGTKGEKVYIIGAKNGWYRVIFEDDVCYIRSDYVDLTEVPYENKSSSNSPIFYKGGKSTGVTPSAKALKDATTPDTSTKEDPAATSSGLMYGIAFTTGTNLRLRSKANSTSTILDNAAKGEVVVVLGKEGKWYKVIYDLQEGYMHSDYLKVYTTGHAELGYGRVNASSLNVRSGPGTSYQRVNKATKGEKVYIIGIKNGWYRVIFEDDVAYVSSKYIDLTETPYENKSSSKSPIFYRGGKSTGVTPSAKALKNSANYDKITADVTGKEIVAEAKKYLGVPYVYGGASPSGFDCSGFVYYVYRSLGIKISRTQAEMYEQGRSVSKSELKPGDLVFFQNTYKAGISHVGIYVGDGKFIHSPHSGEVVSYSNLNSDYYTSHYYGAARFTD